MSCIVVVLENVDYKLYGNNINNPIMNMHETET